MTPVLRVLAAVWPQARTFAADHWRALSVAALALLAALALRGCQREGARANTAEQAAAAAAAQVAATFKAELARAYAAHEALAREVAKAQAAGARPVEVGEGTSERIRIVYRPAAPGIGVWGGDAPATPAAPVKPAAPGAPEDPSAPCVLALGDSVEFVAGTVTIAEKDGTRSAFVGVTLKRFDPDGDLVSGVIRAPLAPAEPRTSLPASAPALPRFALRGGLSLDGDPVLGGDVRLFSRAWAWVEASTARDVRVGLRWEFR